METFKYLQDLVATIPEPYYSSIFWMLVWVKTMATAVIVEGWLDKREYFQGEEDECV